jgi:general secretion pathway protein G
MRIVTTRPAARCAVCHTDLDLLAVACAGCASVAHVECRAALGRCSTLGCVAAAPARRLPATAAFLEREAPPSSGVARSCAGLLLVLGGLWFMAQFVFVARMGQGHEARVQRTAADMRAIGDALDLFRVDCGDYPASLDALWVRPANARKWGPEPYLKEYPPKDPWGNEYQYRYEAGARFEIVSFGADGAPGGVEETQDLSSSTINVPDSR